MGRYTFSLVLNAHTPFIRHPEVDRVMEEQWFFEALSDTYLPLLELCNRLEADHVPFRLGLVLSPTLCHSFQDTLLIQRYLDYVDHQIEFGQAEQTRAAGYPDRQHLAQLFCDAVAEKKKRFIHQYDKKILEAFKYFQRKGSIELLLTTATNAFLPFYTAYPESIQAQFETAIINFRSIFGRYPQGFFLPEMSWTPSLDSYLRAYHFAYTIVDTHGLLLGNPPAQKGIFYPVKTPLGIFVLGRNFNMPQFSQHTVYRDHNCDAGFEFPADLVSAFQASDGARMSTGYRYYNKAQGLYDPDAAARQAAQDAHEFLATRLDEFQEIKQYMAEDALDLYVLNADQFGRFWSEGICFLEALFREIAQHSPDCCVATAAEYLYTQNIACFQTMTPEFSSWGNNGYAETWLDSSNDWIYRHLLQATIRMTELAERFPNAVGIKERTLNQAAREILLAQNSDWTKMLHRQEYTDYARRQVTDSLRNFTTIYEALGGSYLNMEWLTELERRHNIFPDINYRVFRRRIL
ncbi:MAG: DUF1957 domain-containing protein [Spirochaetaceae bacterium]|jgi:1,4-alpha-glucan branching enzyme|nr:DUF1957 domain-containing protein [Spirochaetaceae bacterium]